MRTYAAEMNAAATDASDHVTATQARNNAAIVCKWIRGQVGKWEDEAKAELSEMLPGDRQAALLAGYKIGTVTMCEGRRELAVVDEERLAEWVEKRWPDEVERVFWVRPAFMRVLAERTLIHGALIDNDGEVCDWAELVQRQPYLMTKPDRDMDAVIQDLLYRGYTIDNIIRELPEADVGSFEEAG